MCRKCSADWDDRMHYAELAIKHLGTQAGGVWLWEYTPFPCDLPSWDQIARALHSPDEALR